MYCMICGTHLPANAKFCMSCGTQVGEAPASAPQSGPTSNNELSYEERKKIQEQELAKKIKDRVQNMKLSDSVREKAYTALSEVTTMALKSGQITYPEYIKHKYFAKNIFDKVETYPALLSFLRVVSNKWDIYKSVYEKYAHLDPD